MAVSLMKKIEMKTIFPKKTPTPRRHYPHSELDGLRGFLDVISARNQWQIRSSKPICPQPEEIHVEKDMSIRPKTQL
jgi:hypothetical protein